MELVPIFIIFSVLVCHVLCTENQTEDQGVTLEDGLENEHPDYQGSKFKPKIKVKKPFIPRVITPGVGNRNSTKMNTTELVLIVVGAILLIAVISGIRYGCRKYLKGIASREEQSNVTIHPPPSINNNYISPADSSNGAVNPSFSTFPEPFLALGISSDTMLKENADLPPSYSEVVTKDFNKMSRDKFPSVMKKDFGATPEQPPPDY